MASTRQIEHLERKHRENPEGLTFAPLANAYRNSGQPERAIETLLQGLDHHPKHAPARIVLGRCHLDLGDDTAAEAAFAEVLDLDRENVVALKALADIAERGGRFDAAITWLDQLLEADRNNEEAREQLARVTESQAQSPMPAEPAPAPDAGLDEDQPAIELLPPTDSFAPAEDSDPMAPPPEPVTVDSPWGDASQEPEDEPAAEPMAWGLEELGTPVESAEEVTPPSPWEPPAIDPAAVDHETSPSDGPGGPSEEIPLASVTDPPVEPAVTDFDFSVGGDESISLTPAAENEFQAPDDAAGLALNAEAGNEFQAEGDGSNLELHASEENEFQRVSDADLLSPAPDQVEDSDDPEEVESSSQAYSWFSPAAEEQIEPTAPPESGPDESPPFEAWEAATSVPFEETDPLPSPWSPAEAVEEAAPQEQEVETETTADYHDAGEPPLLGLDPRAESEPAVGSDDPFTPEPVEEPDLVATETMAEVYLSQGHRFEALQVYRALLESSPEDSRLSEKVGALESEIEAANAQAEAPADESSRTYSARTTGGQTVKSLFKGLLSTKPFQRAAPAEPPPEQDPASPAEAGAHERGGDVVGEPTRPAQDALSLSAIFGEDSSPVPPAVANKGDDAQQQAGFSFDSFFGGEGEEDAATKRPAFRRPQGRENEEDLDQFQAWLQGLKG